VRSSPALREIERLDPVRDAERIVQLDACFEFPFDVTRSLELAFFRTFAVPSIAELLDSTGEFVERARKRYDDTDLLISTFSEQGHSTPAGRAAIRRMNGIHGRFPIANDDFLYVLSTMVLEPIRWNERFGWRPLLETERLATFHFWREVGRLMNIREIPETLAELDRFNVEFERGRFGYTEAGHRVAVAMVAMFVGKLPGVPTRLGARGIYALLDEPLLAALRLPRPSAAERAAVEGALRLRARALWLLPPRRKPRLRTEQRRRTYPRGYRIEELGPPPAAAR
jgi:ER-bound oxygenase mpaB/B'/Rubber oxygenase, catalytic domain